MEKKQKLLFVYTWDEWFDLTYGKQDEPVICPRCKPKTLSVCDCYTPSFVEDEDLETIKKDGRTWAIQPIPTT